MGFERLHNVPMSFGINVYEIAVTNAANHSLFMVNVYQVLMCEYRKNDPDFSILDLKAPY